MSERFPRPLRATRHCRHYSYIVPFSRKDSGPRCARAVDLTAPGATRKCMPDEAEGCALREDFTEAERAAWEGFQAERLARIRAAVQALPRPLPLDTGGVIACPSCGGRLNYARWHRGAAIACATPHCCEVRYSIAAGADWPAS